MKVLFITALLVMTASASRAEGKKPPPESQKKTEPTLKKAQDGADQALDGVEKGVKEAAGTLKTGANKALQAVDDTIHNRK